MKKLISNVYNAVAITVGLGIVFLIASVKRIEEKHDDSYFWE